MKNLAQILLALLISFNLLNAQDQILLQEDFNNGIPLGWQSQSILGNNQWVNTDNGGNNLNGTDMMYIQSLPGQPTVTEFILPQLAPAFPTIQNVVFGIGFNMLAEQNSILKLVQFDDQQPQIPIELAQLDLTSCDPLFPWGCPQPFLWDVQLPLYDPLDQYVLVYEDLGASGTDFFALDDIFVWGFNFCPIGLILDTNYPPTCFNGTDALVEVTGILGIPPYSYSIDGGAGQASGSFVTIPGPHMITVVDAIGCTTTITVVVPNATDLSFSYAAAAPTCFDGNDAAIAGSASGGTPGYMYSLDGGIAQGNGSFTTTAGVHNVMVIDANGCTKVFALTVPNADPIGIQQTVFPPTCEDGNDAQINVTASGGTPPYTYSLNGGAVQGNGNFITTSGIHFITVTDANGCTKVFTITVPNAPTLVFNHVAGAPLCFNGNTGSIVGSAAGGLAPYTYSLDFGPAQGNGTFQGLTPGLYFITVVDANGCTKTFNIVVPNTPDMAINFVHSAAVSCFGGADATISVTSVTNGVAPFAYTLNGAAGGPTWVNQSPGAYTLVVTDSRPCSKTVTFTIAEPAPLAIGAVINNVSCAGASDGILTPVVGGGTPPLQTRLDGGAYGAPVNYPGLAPSLHTLEVIDFNGCTIGASWNVSQPLPIVSDTASVTPSSGTDGAIDVETNGGNPPYFYLWSNAETTQDIDNLPPGEYYLLTTDINLCLSDTLFVTVPSTVDPTACVAANFTNAPTGLLEDQTVAGGTKTQLKWDHYGEATTGCIIKGGTIGTMDVNEPYTQNPGQVLVQGTQVLGDVNGHDVSAQLAPNSTFTLFNPNTFPAGPTGAMVAGAFYKWQVRCGCIIDQTLPLPDRLANSNVHISPWSDLDLFTNLTPVVEGGNMTSFGFDEKSSISLYPNPSQGSFYILFKDLEEGMAQIDIRNILGEVIYSNSEGISQNNQIMEIDLTNQTAGMYIIQVEQNSNIISSKMIIN